MTRAPRAFTVGSWAQGTARGSSRAGRRPAPGWSGGLPIASLSLQQYPTQDSLAEWSKALASGASPQGRGLEPHSCHLLVSDVLSSPGLLSRATASMGSTTKRHLKIP